MRIILAEPRGFCAGVTMAVQSLDRAVREFGTPVYVYHEIVHNTWIVENFCRKGVIFVDTLDEVPHGSRLMFSAHGVSPEIRKIAQERSLETIDATCTLVNKVHQNATEYARQGYKIILLGHRHHDEVVGVVGEVPDSIWVVENEEEINALAFGTDDKLAYLTQTTLSMTETFQQIELLKKRFPKIMGPPQSNICYATQSRQDAVRKHCPNADVVIVVGSWTSSNSRRLAEQAEELGIGSFLVDRADDIPLDKFTGNETILITAGASAPEHLVQECIELLQKQFNAVLV
ncbi:MAG: 4-hydroxy-3-methylbut-2-enyl diphosphate reductase [Planctomycetaceae bacterium]|nr:4-hydroxy-3-methylbut-2-enyl diphosphate reductase [Planctomycetaceae bacterium]